MKLLFLTIIALSLVACSASATPTPTPPIRPSAPSATIAPQAGGKTVPKRYSAPPEMTIDPSKNYSATIKTNMGDINVELLAGDAPRTVNNFVFLARDDFYDGVKFHRVIKGFMVQTGDPLGNGTGGPGYRFDDELANAPRDGYKRGTLAMANAGPNTNGSQFFIMDADYALPPQYTVFGRVTQGNDVVNKIASVPTSGREGSSPNVDVHIDDIVIEEK